MWNSIKICYVSFFWSFSGKKLVNITYIALFGLAMCGFGCILLIFNNPFISINKINGVGILLISMGILLIYTQMIVFKTLPELPGFIVGRVSKLLVYRTEIPSNSETDQEFITAMKELLPMYVSSQKNEDFIKLRSVYINYCEYSNRSRELLSENSH